MYFKESLAIPYRNGSRCLLVVSVFFFILLSSCTTTSEKKSVLTNTELNNLFDISSQMADSSDIRQSLQFLDSAIAPNKLDVSEKFKVLAYKCGTYYRKQDVKNAMKYADSMLLFIEKHGKETYKKEYALANYSKGDILFLMKAYNEAYKYYFHARLIGRMAVDSCTLSEYSYRIGMILFQQASFKEAARNFEEAWAQSSGCVSEFKWFYRRQEIMSNIAFSYMKAGMPDSAIKYYDKALAYVTQHDGKYENKESLIEIAKGVIYGHSAEAYKDKGNYTLAESLLKKSIAINTKKGYDNKDAEYSQLQLAHTYYLTGDLENMHELLGLSRQTLDTVTNPSAEIEWNRLMWKYYEKKNMDIDAYKYLLKYTELKNLAEKETTSLTANDVNHQIMSMEDQYKIDSLSKKNELKNLYLLVFIITTALGIAIFLFSLYILKNTRKNLEMQKQLHNQIEEQKLALEQTLIQLEEKGKEKDRILRVVAHDLRTPVASIAMLTDLIVAEPAESERSQMLQLIKTSCTNLLALITEILEAGRLNKTELQKEETGVNELLKTIVSSLRFKAAEKQQQISLYLLKDEEKILVNKEKITRVITNLITNAVKFSSVNADIEVKAIKKETTIEIIVQDHGVGIPDEMKSKVFDMFTEAKRTGTAGEKPFGLGLSICKQIVEAHGGKIWFESNLNEGTTFHIEL